MTSTLIPARNAAVPNSLAFLRELLKDVYRRAVHLPDREKRELIPSEAGESISGAATPKDDECACPGIVSIMVGSE